MWRRNKKKENEKAMNVEISDKKKDKKKERNKKIKKVTRVYDDKI